MLHSVDVLVGWLVVWLVGWLVGWSVSQSVKFYNVGGLYLGGPGSNRTQCI
jgi:hypothetical protein